MEEFLIKLIVAIIIGLSNAIIFIYGNNNEWFLCSQTKIKKPIENKSMFSLVAGTMIEAFIILILMGVEV